MRRELSDIKIRPSKAYNCTEYDNVWIVLKGYNELWKHRILWSEKRQKYILHGRIIELVIESDGGQHVVRSYPLRGSIAFVDSKDWQMYSTCQYSKKKEEKIMHIHYSWIDYILLDFNSLDWKR